MKLLVPTRHCRVCYECTKEQCALEFVSALNFVTRNLGGAACSCIRE